ncbi:MAG: class I SAM-dependent methyltransferase, partial [Calditrichaceae bacterium]
LKRNAGKLTLEDLARFVDSFDSLDRLLYRIEKQSQNFFAQIHKNWDDIRNRFLDSDKLNKIMGGFGNRKEKMTLDLGSGTGFIAIHCALNGNTVFSVDLNKAMLSKQMEVKNKLNLNNQYLFQADINKLPFVNYRFDEVFLTLVLHHISDPPGMLKNVAKMVDKNGILIIIDFIRHSNRRFADQMHDLWLGFNPDNLQKWLKPAGLRCENEYVWHSASQIDIFCQVYRKN